MLEIMLLFFVGIQIIGRASAIALCFFAAMYFGYLLLNKIFTKDEQ